MSEYLDILKEWERDVAMPVIFEHIGDLFPLYGFRRIRTDRDKWVSPLKIDLSRPKTPNREKTVVEAADMRFREQGDWGNGISVVDMLMKEYGTGSLFDTIRFIAGRYGLDMPTFAGKGSRGYSDRSDRKRVLEALENYFVWNLWNNPGQKSGTVRRYLSCRGFSEDEIRKFRFGFVPDWNKVKAYITSPRMGITEEKFAEACSVCSEEGYTSVGIKHVLALPYRCGGEIKGFLFRAVDDGVLPKYRANTGLDRKKTFFNMPEDRDEKHIIIVEGEMDALTASAAGIKNVVAIGGSDLSGERRNQIFDALNRNTVRITLCLDLDTNRDGEPDHQKRFGAIKRSLHAIFDVSPDFNELYVACLPYPSDPDSYIRKKGPESFNRIIRESLPWWEYLYTHLARRCTPLLK